MRRKQVDMQQSRHAAKFVWRLSCPKNFKKMSKVDMQLSSSGGCLVKHAVTAVRRERQKSAGVEGSLGARADL